MIDCIDQSQLLNSMWTAPGWFIHQLEVQIYFWSLAEWPPSFSTLHSSSLWRTDSIIFAELNKHPIFLNATLWLPFRHLQWKHVSPKETLVCWGETGKLVNLGFPWCKMNSKLDFREKRQGFNGKKPNWNTLWRTISRDINSSAKWDALKITLVSRFSLLFWGNWPKLLLEQPSG